MSSHAHASDLSTVKAVEDALKYIKTCVKGVLAKTATRYFRNVKDRVVI